MGPVVQQTVRVIVVALCFLSLQLGRKMSGDSHEGGRWLGGDVRSAISLLMDAGVRHT